LEDSPLFHISIINDTDLRSGGVIESAAEIQTKHKFALERKYNINLKRIRNKK
jgi:hypothetical protein